MARRRFLSCSDERSLLRKLLSLVLFAKVPRSVTSQACEAVDSGEERALAYTIVITEKGGTPRSEEFEANELTIGRVNGNHIVLPKGNISKKHSRIVKKDGKFIIVDLKSTNGTYVNGNRIATPVVLKDTDKVYIGDFILQILEADPPPDANSILFQGTVDPSPMIAGPIPLSPVESPLQIDPPPPPVKTTKPPQVNPLSSVNPAIGGNGHDPGPAPPGPVLRLLGARTRRQPLSIDLPPQVALRGREAVFLVVSKHPLGDGGLLPEDDLEKTRLAAEKSLTGLAKKFVGANTEGWALQIAREVCGLGPLGELLEDPSVVEVFVNGPHQILVRRAPDSSSIGIPLVPVPAFFSSDEAVALVVRRIMHAAGVKFDADHPIAEARLPDGTRVNAVHHAAAVKGPLVTISRSSTRNATLDELVAETMLSKNMADFLELCIRARRNVCVCGGPGAQIGTLMSAMASTIADDERIVVVEQVARLKLLQPHVVTLEPRPLKGGPSAATVRDLVGNALRMRPNRVIVHEVTSGEAHDLFIAMGGRQDGTLFTTYAATTRDCLDRLETLISMAGLDVPSRVVREQISSSLDVIVTMTRFADGSSRVTQISEVTGVEVDLVTTQDLFTFKREGFDDTGAVMGRFQATGTPPRFYEELQRRGDLVNLAIFRDSN